MAKGGNTGQILSYHLDFRDRFLEGSRAVCGNQNVLHHSGGSLPRSWSRWEAGGKPDLAEIDRQLNNPLTSLWSLTFQDNLGIKQGDQIEGSTYSNLLFFQPAMPVPVGDDLVFIAGAQMSLGQ